MQKTLFLARERISTIRTGETTVFAGNAVWGLEADQDVRMNELSACIVQAVPSGDRYTVSPAWPVTY